VSKDQPIPLYEVGSNKFDDLLAEYKTAAQNTHVLGDPCAVLASFFADLPMAAYIKAVQPDGSLRMMWVNRAYEREVGVTLAEYNALEDCMLWDIATAKAFRDNDEKVLQTGRAVAVTELAPSRQSPGVTVEWKGWKWPIVVDGQNIAICGYAVSSEDGGHGRQG